MAEWIDHAFVTDGGEENGSEAAIQEDEDHIDIVHVPDNVDDESLSRVELENQLKRLFSQSKNKPKKTLFFVLPDRS